MRLRSLNEMETRLKRPHSCSETCQVRSTSFAVHSWPCRSSNVHSEKLGLTTRLSANVYATYQLFRTRLQQSKRPASPATANSPPAYSSQPPSHPLMRCSIHSRTRFRRSRYSSACLSFCGERINGRQTTFPCLLLTTISELPV